MTPTATSAFDSSLRVIRQSLTPDERALFEERASVMEFDGKMSREIAEREALWDVARQRRLPAS